MSDIARLVAVADLLVDDCLVLDRGAIARTAAQQAARLTRAGYAQVNLFTRDGSDRYEYPADLEGGHGRIVLEAAFESGSVAGVVSVADSVDGRFTSLDAWLLDIVARRIESQLAVLDLHQAELNAREVLHDADVAGELQRALVSADRRVTSSARAAGDLRPARRVGGDLFDLLEVGDDLIAVLADVSGKGAPASLLTSALLSSVQHHVAAIGARPARLLAAVSASIDGMLTRTGRIVTLAIAAVNSGGGFVRIASAGHHPVFVNAGGRVVMVQPTTPPLGVVAPRLDEHVLEFPVGSSVLLASDGLVDQRDPEGVPFGMERLAAALVDATGSEPADVVAHVLGVSRDYARGAVQDDDCAAVVIVSGGRHEDA